MMMNRYVRKSIIGKTKPITFIHAVPSTHQPPFASSPFFFGSSFFTSWITGTTTGT